MSSNPNGSLRRSSRLKESNGSRPSEANAVVDTPDTPPPPKRRRKSAVSTSSKSSTSGGSLRGRKGLLSMLPDMPLDILFEIFAHLEPYDMLHLARTTKALRNLLMSRSSITVWRRARANRPDLLDCKCPSDMSEPAYANLLFDPHCHFCIKARVMRGMWANRVRCCKKCLKEYFSDDVPSAPPLRPSKDFILVPQDTIDGKLYHSKAKVQRLREQVAECRGDASALKVLRRKQITTARLHERFGHEAKAWWIVENEKRQEEKNILRVRRCDQIIDRLGQIGYDIEYLSPAFAEKFLAHPLVQQPKEITDRIWNNIKEPMIEFAQRACTDMRMREHCARYLNRLTLIRDLTKDWILVQPMWVPTPSVADLSWYCPEYKTFLENGGYLVSGELSVSAFQWTCAMVRKLGDLIPEEALRLASAGVEDNTAKGKGKAELGAPSQAQNVGQRATTTLTPINNITILRTSHCWFRCTVNGCLVDYPRVLSHHCLKTGPPLTMDPKSDMDDLQNAYNIVLEEFPWNFTGDKAVYDMDAHRATEKIKRAVLTKVSDLTSPDLCPVTLNLLNERFACGECSTDGLACVMPWKVAVAHLTQPSHRGRDIKVTVLDDPDRLRVLAEEAKRMEPKFDEQYKVWGCVHCRSSQAMPLIEVVEHCMTAHDITDPEEEDDYDMHPDAETLPGIPADEEFYVENWLTTKISH
ncbi:hypothetical protein C8Q76DRAFT_745779 [Earliella scabrosa]|nr:hypothetical protein C8Q76DRAFT_745779 [Earliella scabrosa]